MFVQETLCCASYPEAQAWSKLARGSRPHGVCPGPRNGALRQWLAWCEGVVGTVRGSVT